MPEARPALPSAANRIRGAKHSAHSARQQSHSQPDARQVLELFHPAVARWFESEVGVPSEPQVQGWPAIQSGRDSLILAPTGAGKTLAAFLSGIDQLLRLALAGELVDQTYLLYVSPLKALSNDVHKNLAQPLSGIARQCQALGLPVPEIRSLVRTGDTPTRERTLMLRRPPHVLVTTPESLFILLNSEKSRQMLSTATTVIVDEIHALLGDKRGAHLALSLERLDHLCARRLVRIGLSATQRPIEHVAEFLVGTGGAPREACASATTREVNPTSGEPLPLSRCEIIDCGHGRERDLALELPASPLQAVMEGEVWLEIHQRLCSLIEQHRTTLIFVNTRRLAERLTKHLSETLGKDAIASHHGSLSKEQRLRAEERLKTGQLRALVATASLELGIDIGEVDLVCQVGSVRRIGTFLQRVGRSGHRLDQIPKGRLFPLSRDELVEAAALLRAVQNGELDRIQSYPAPLDILAQQITAAAAAEDWSESELLALMRRAEPYRELSQSQFDAVVRMLSEGFSTRRGRRGARIHYDAVNRRIRGRKGSRIIANTSGGAIPELADYEVVEEPSGQRVGSVNEDFAIESMAGDIFQLGNTSWRILRVEPGKVRVNNAEGQAPTIPFWLGEAPARSAELSSAVSRLRQELARVLEGVIGTGGSRRDALDHARLWLERSYALSDPGARQVVDYLGASYFALGTLPTRENVVIERFFDESGGMQLVLHSPRGARLNRAWGLSLRKRFCQRFNFELQAAATEDAIVLSLGPTHSFPLEEVFGYVRSHSVRELLIQAVLDAPMFMTRWRWNTTRALAVLRWRGGKKVPPRFQRMDADDLLSVVFPDSTACAENLQGAREIPDHPLVTQTLDDCLNEAMDLEAFIELLQQIERGELDLVARDVTEPSPLCQEILTARPYAFLDDAPLEERRTQAVMARRWLDPSAAEDLGALDPSAIARVRAEAWPEPSSPDELHDALVLCGFLSCAEGETHGWQALYQQLEGDRRAATIEYRGSKFWIAAERLPQVLLAFTDCRQHPRLQPPHNSLSADSSLQARVELLRGRLEAVGPTSPEGLGQSCGLSADEVSQAFGVLESEGFILRGRFEPGLGEQYCERRLLSRIHRYTLNRLRQEIQPVSTEVYLRFLLGWQHLAPGSRLEGPRGVLHIAQQLEGFEVPARGWESEIFARRVERYAPSDLDGLCLSGQLVWCRTRPSSSLGRKSLAPIASTPIALLPREYQGMWIQSHASESLTSGARTDALSGFSRAPAATRVPAERDEALGDAPGLSPGAERVWQALGTGGAAFFGDLLRAVGGLRTELELALGELVGHGLVTSDSFDGLRALTYESKPGGRRPHLDPRAERFARAGRWARLARPAPQAAADQLPDSEQAEHVAGVLLGRWGVVFRKLLERENVSVPWRDLLRVLRSKEARGEVRGGRFVAGFTGEQYARPEAVAELREVARRVNSEREQAHVPPLVCVSGADPLNLMGVLSGQERVPALVTNRVLYRGGLPVGIKAGREVTLLGEVPTEQRAELQRALTVGVRSAQKPQRRDWGSEESTLPARG